jgi:hypothetical protein
MSQPPSSPHGVDVPGAGQPGAWGAPVGSDDPTRQFGPPGQREPTRRLDQSGPYGPPGPYGQAPYGPPPYGQGPPPYGQPWAPPGTPPRKNRNLTMVLVVAAVVVLAAAGVALWLLFGRGDDSRIGSLPPATVTPDDLGADSVLDSYAADCYEGSMDSCDALYMEAEAGSLYERYGDTCAGRQPPGTNVFCTVSFPSG